ncbi:hypothetical protein F4815DRAFT_502454 [Daldinia loculata]|nr:hypothetical protein F4815DRAFT_502454 [Daldinia loculata]
MAGTRISLQKVAYLYLVPARILDETSGTKDVRPLLIEHRLTASLSEPEAVAIFSVREDQINLQDDNNVLVVDAGGGTIDICLAKVKVSTKNDILLAELKPNIGENSGSTYIDTQFQQLALKELEKAGHERLGGEPVELAWRMMNSEEFQNYKHGFTGHRDDKDGFFVKIPKLDGKVSFEEANIANGELRVRWGQLKSMFDEQIKDIEDNIDEMVMDGKRVDHIILSGGLGSSPYVQRQLQARFRKQSSYLQNASFHLSSKPQLCVSQGLVYERVRSLYNGSSTFTKLCSQDSFGIMTRVEYESWKLSHRLAKKQNGVERNQLDGGRLVKRVDWLIRKGDETKSGDKFTRELRCRFENNLKNSDLVGDISVEFKYFKL